MTCLEEQIKVNEGESLVASLSDTGNGHYAGNEEASEGAMSMVEWKLIISLADTSVTLSQAIESIE